MLCNPDQPANIGNKASLVAQQERVRLSMQERQVESLGQQDPLEKQTAAHSSILAGKSHGHRSLVGYSP